jgi:ferredoxin-NADP reductase/Na+-transporting NADH:ubiquinone oxidoreductase subunit NqrB
MLNTIDRWLNQITMYRLLLYGLITIAVWATALGFLGVLPYAGLQFMGSAVLLIFISALTNYIFAKITGAATNTESYAITALILFCIMTPPSTPAQFAQLAAVAAIAMASKYIFAIGKKHLFNPAAIALVILGVFGSAESIWWIATSSMLPLVVILGTLVVRKIRRSSLVISFLITALVIMFVDSPPGLDGLVDFISISLTSWPLIFLGTIMLSEPLTTPPTKKLQILYGVLVGILFNLRFSIGPLHSTPELALVLGNIFSYLVSSKQKLQLTLQSKKQLSTCVHEFVFTPNQKLKFSAGQYLEWTLAHKNVDARGNRRFFTVASSPTESNIELGISTAGDKLSSFKRALLSLEVGQELYAGQLSGDFTLPKDQNQKLVFIAGGIGITPFRSMVKYLLDTNQKRDIILLYTCSHQDDFAYLELFTQAAKAGVKLVKIATSEQGHLTEVLIKKEVADYPDRRYYLSGSNAMVVSYENLLENLGIPRANIVTDYFPGL